MTAIRSNKRNNSNLERRVKQKFPIPFGAEDGGLDDVGAGTAFGQERLANLVDCGGLGSLVADNATFANVLAPSFELRLHQHDELLTVTLDRERCRDDRRQKQRGRNERDVNGDELDELAELFVGQIAGVGFLQQPYSWVLPEAEINLPMASVDGDDPRSPVLQEAIGETAGGSADIQTNFAAHVDAPMLQSFFELEPAAADVLQVFTKQTNIGVGCNRGAGFLHLLSVDEYVAREDQRLGTFAGRHQAAIQEQFVEPELHHG